MAGKSKSPAFQFYAAEWLADENVRLMTLEQTGAYIDALAICWREGSIPACPEMLARLIGKGCTTDVATVVQRLFNVRCTDERFAVERLKHKRLEIEREKQQVRSEQAAKAGKKSADVKRAGKEKPRRGKKFNERSTDVQRPYNPSSSSSDEDGRVKRFIPPTVQEVADYCLERGNKVEPQRFIDHYTSNGWKVGRNKMADWRAAVRNVWEKGQFSAPGGAKPEVDLFAGQREFMERRQRNAKPDSE